MMRTPLLRYATSENIRPNELLFHELSHVLSKGLVHATPEAIKACVSVTTGLAETDNGIEILVDYNNQSILNSIIKNFDDLKIQKHSSGIEDVMEMIHALVENSTIAQGKCLDIIKHLVQIIMESDIWNFTIQLEAAKLLTLILETNEAIPDSVLNSKEVVSFLDSFGECVKVAGDYELQATIMEAIFRILTCEKKNDLVSSWFPDPHIRNMFQAIRNEEFETDGRRFLNVLNSLDPKSQMVYSFPAIVVSLGRYQLRQPFDSKVTDFWVDFNLRSRSISTFVNDDSSNADNLEWEIVCIKKDDIRDFRVNANEEKTIVILKLAEPAYLLAPFCPQANESYVKLVFERKYHLNLSKALEKLFGQVKYVDLPISSPSVSSTPGRYLGKTSAAISPLTVHNTSHVSSSKSEEQITSTSGFATKKKRSNNQSKLKNEDVLTNEEETSNNKKTSDTNVETCNNTNNSNSQSNMSNKIIGICEKSKISVTNSSVNVNNDDTSKNGNNDNNLNDKSHSKDNIRHINKNNNFTGEVTHMNNEGDNINKMIDNSNLQAGSRNCNIHNEKGNNVEGINASTTTNNANNIIENIDTKNCNDAKNLSDNSNNTTVKNKHKNKENITKSQKNNENKNDNIDGNRSHKNACENCEENLAVHFEIKKNNKTTESNNGDKNCDEDRQTTADQSKDNTINRSRRFSSRSQKKLLPTHNVLFQDSPDETYVPAPVKSYHISEKKRQEAKMMSEVAKGKEKLKKVEDLESLTVFDFPEEGKQDAQCNQQNESGKLKSKPGKGRGKKKQTEKKTSNETVEVEVTQEENSPRRSRRNLNKKVNYKDVSISDLDENVGKESANVSQVQVKEEKNAKQHNPLKNKRENKEKTDRKSVSFISPLTETISYQKESGDSPVEYVEIKRVADDSPTNDTGDVNLTPERDDVMAFGRELDDVGKREEVVQWDYSLCQQNSNFNGDLTSTLNSQQGNLKSLSPGNVRPFERNIQLGWAKKDRKTLTTANNNKTKTKSIDDENTEIDVYEFTGDYGQVEQSETFGSQETKNPVKQPQMRRPKSLVSTPWSQQKKKQERIKKKYTVRKPRLKNENNCNSSSDTEDKLRTDEKPPTKRTVCFHKQQMKQQIKRTGQFIQATSSRADREIELDGGTSVHEFKGKRTSYSDKVTQKQGPPSRNYEDGEENDASVPYTPQKTDENISRNEKVTTKTPVFKIDYPDLVIEDEGNDNIIKEGINKRINFTSSDNALVVHEDTSENKEHKEKTRIKVSLSGKQGNELEIPKKVTRKNAKIEEQHLKEELSASKDTRRKETLFKNQEHDDKEEMVTSPSDSQEKESEQLHLPSTITSSINKARKGREKNQNLSQSSSDQEQNPKESPRVIERKDKKVKRSKKRQNRQNLSQSEQEDETFSSNSNRRKQLKRLQNRQNTSQSSSEYEECKAKKSTRRKKSRKESEQKSGKPYPKEAVYDLSDNNDREFDHMSSVEQSQHSDFFNETNAETPSSNMMHHPSKHQKWVNELNEKLDSIESAVGPKTKGKRKLWKSPVVILKNDVMISSPEDEKTVKRGAKKLKGKRKSSDIRKTVKVTTPKETPKVIADGSQQPSISNTPISEDVVDFMKFCENMLQEASKSRDETTNSVIADESRDISIITTEIVNQVYSPTSSPVVKRKKVDFNVASSAMTPVVPVSFNEVMMNEVDDQEENDKENQSKATFDYSAILQNIGVDGSKQMDLESTQSPTLSSTYEDDSMEMSCYKNMKLELDETPCGEGHEIQSLLQTFSHNVTKSVNNKNQVIERFVKSVTKMTRKKMNSLWENQAKTRVAMDESYYKQYTKVFDEWKSYMKQREKHREKMLEQLKEIWRIQNEEDTKRLNDLRDHTLKMFEERKTLVEKELDANDVLQNQLQLEIRKMKKQILHQAKVAEFANVRRSLKAMLNKV